MRVRNIGGVLSTFNVLECSWAGCGFFCRAGFIYYIFKVVEEEVCMSRCCSMTAKGWKVLIILSLLGMV